MYSVIQLEKMTGVSRGTLYKRLESEQLKDYVQTVDGTLKLKEQGLDALYSSIEHLVKQKDADNERTDEYSNKHVERLEEQIRRLESKCSEWEYRYIEKCNDWENKYNALVEKLDKSQSDISKYLYIASENNKPRGIFNIFKTKTLE